MIRIGSCFAGIGGLELGIGLGLSRSNIPHRVEWQCEIDPFAQKVLRRHWPSAQLYPDITQMGAESPNVDIVCGGFPCQDISVAGAGAGLDGARSGLFFDLLRVACDVGCRVLVLENVAAILARGGSRVAGALAEAGFDASWAIVSAADMGAPHLRQRWFCVAWRPVANAERQRVHGQYIAGASGSPVEPVRDGPNGRVADTDSEGQSQQGGVVDTVGGWIGDGGLGHPNSARLEVMQSCQVQDQFTPTLRADGGGSERSAQPRVGRVSDGVSSGLDRGRVRWPAGRGAYQHAWEPSRVVAPRSVANRPARIKALGNAVVPQCAQLITEALVAPALHLSGVLP